MSESRLLLLYISLNSLWHSSPPDTIPASLNIRYPLCKDIPNGDLSSSSFSISPQRELPQVPSPAITDAEQTYSNLNFSKPAQEVLYEVVKVKEGEREPPSPRAKKEGPKSQKDQAVRVEYACVPPKKPQSEREPATSQSTAVGQPYPARIIMDPPIVKVQEVLPFFSAEGIGLLLLTVLLARSGISPPNYDVQFTQGR